MIFRKMSNNPLNPDYFMISTGISEQNFSNLNDIVKTETLNGCLM